MFKFLNKYIFIFLIYSIYLMGQEKRFAVIISTYNNAAFCKANLYGLLSQDYDNYHCIIIDDCSKDQTYKKILNYIEKSGKSEKFKIIRNKTRRLKIANLYNAIHNYCDDNDVVVIYDGDDWFATDKVLSYLNDIYSTMNIWLTHGGYKTYPNNRKGFCRPVPKEVIESNSFRSYSRTTSQLRTFYAWLFKQVPISEFFYEGKFLPMVSDVAKMMPMFEMAGERIHFIDKEVYIYNLANVINDHKVNGRLQSKINDYILKRKPFKRLNSKPLFKKVKQSLTDILLLVKNKKDISLIPNILRNLVNCKNIDNILFIGKINLKFNFNDLLNLDLDNIDRSNLYNKSKNQNSNYLLNEISSKYLLLGSCSNAISKLKDIDFQNLSKWLNKTKTYTINLGNIKFNTDKTEKLSSNIYALEYSNLLQENIAKDLVFVKYSKVESLLESNNISFIEEPLLLLIKSQIIKLDDIGLYIK